MNVTNERKIKANQNPGTSATDKGDFPWEMLLGFALVRLRMTASDFWALSMPELCSAIAYLSPNNRSPHPHMKRDDLSQLMSKFPDASSLNP